jgi:hypothetical protein
MARARRGREPRKPLIGKHDDPGIEPATLSRLRLPGHRLAWYPPDNVGPSSAASRVIGIRDEEMRNIDPGTQVFEVGAPCDLRGKGDG